MTFVPCCRCGNISVIAPLQRVMKVFSTEHQAPTLFEHTDNNLNDSLDSSYITDIESYPPILSLLLKPKSMYLKELNQTQFSHQLTDLTSEIPLNYQTSPYRATALFDKRPRNQQRPGPSSFTPSTFKQLKAIRSTTDISQERHYSHNDASPSKVIDSVYLKCKKCNTIFVINVTKKNIYLSKLAFQLQQSQTSKSGPLPSFSEPNSHPNDATEMAILTSPTIEKPKAMKNENDCQPINSGLNGSRPKSPTGMISIRPSSKTRTPQLQELLMLNVPKVVCHLIYGTDDAQPEILRERPFTRSRSPTPSYNSLVSLLPDEITRPGSDDPNEVMFETPTIPRSHLSGSDKGSLLGSDWLDADFEYMFSSREQTPPEIRNVTFM